MKHTVSMKENHLFRRRFTKGKCGAPGLSDVSVRPTRVGRDRRGLTVGTKVGKAVRRNKVRRRIREAYRIHEETMTTGWDIVVVARVRAACAS